MANSKDIVPMKAVECPLCKGKGRVMNDVVKTKIKCHGCEGKGWVEVHYAQIGEAPKFIPQTVPYPPIPHDPYKREDFDPYIKRYKEWSEPNVSYSAVSQTTDSTYKEVAKGKEKIII